MVGDMGLRDALPSAVVQITEGHTIVIILIILEF